MTALKVILVWSAVSCVVVPLIGACIRYGMGSPSQVSMKSTKVLRNAA